jgi:hypothetical protein
MKAPDLLRRFTSTPLTADLCVLGRAVRLETNSGAILEQARRAFATHSQPLAGGADFLWRLVEESSDQSRPALPATVIADDGLFFINLDRHGFIAVDTEAREAVGFLPGSAEETLLRALLSAVTATALGLGIVSASHLSLGTTEVQS